MTMGIGLEFPIELSLSAVKIKGLWNAIGIIRDITERKRTEEALKTRERELEEKSRYLEETNMALKVFLRHREADRIELQRNVLSSVKELIIPYIEMLKKPCSPADHSAYLDILQTNLNNIVSPFLRNITLNQFNLTSKEIQIANLVKDGKATKEIADLMRLSTKAIEFHRNNIRAKLGLKHKNTNL